MAKADRDRLARRAARLWGYVTLSGVLTLAVFVIWHLVRRGRLLRDRSMPIRAVQLPEISGEAPPASRA
jgi:hypothetical protein